VEGSFVSYFLYHGIFLELEFVNGSSLSRSSKTL